MKYSCDTCSKEYKAETAVYLWQRSYLLRACWLLDFDLYSDFNALGRSVGYIIALRGIAQYYAEIFLKMVRDLWGELCSYDNLFMAYKKARKHKTKKQCVIEFEKELIHNLSKLKTELENKTYKPKPLKTFTIRDPKTRKISKSDFRDRIIHHALCNIIEPIFEKSFIYDSYANRKGKGALKAIERFDYFKRKASKNNTRTCFILKADVKHYFDEVNHELLVGILRKRIKDERIIWLIKRILLNYSLKQKGKGTPLGNLTSQFFANVYLNQLDYFIKQNLKVEYYLRYVDDFVIFEKDKKKLGFYKIAINEFLLKYLKIELHPDKSKVICLGNSINFLGFRIFYYHKLLKKSNLRKMKFNLVLLKENYEKRETNYDKIYNFLEGWFAYTRQANTYNLRNKVIAELEKGFPGQLSTKEINRLIKEYKKVTCFHHRRLSMSGIRTITKSMGTF